MAEIGIKKIKIAKKGDVSDSFFDSSGLSSHPFNRFNEIEFVQETASLTDEIVDDENGTYHLIDLIFSTRKSFNHWKTFINAYIDIPVIILVEAIDGNNYVIGSNKSPAYITITNNYKNIDTRELTTSCHYKNKKGLLQVEFNKHLIHPDDDIEEHIIIDKPVVMVPWQGGNGVISVSSTSLNWNTQTILNK